MRRARGVFGTLVVVLAFAVLGLVGGAALVGMVELECVGDFGCPKGQSCLIFHGAKTQRDTPALVTICRKRCGPEFGGCPPRHVCAHSDPGPEGFTCVPP